MNTEKLREAIGPRADFYLKRFEKIERAGGGLVAGWNWTAFAFSTAWFTYRRLDGWATGNFFLLVFGVLAAYVAESQVVFGAVMLATFGLIPAYADAIYYRRLKARLAQADAAEGKAAAKKAPRPPSAWTLTSAVLSSVLALVVPACVMVAPAAYSDYTPRARVSEGISIASAMKTDIGEFYAEHRRLPSAVEAAQFRIEAPMKYTESVAYDAERRMIVATMREGYLAGKRLAMHVKEENGTLVWICRTIDLEPKYLPASCR
jgi:type IV pilus assembly protein PilA